MTKEINSVSDNSSNDYEEAVKLEFKALCEYDEKFINSIPPSFTGGGLIRWGVLDPRKKDEEYFYTAPYKILKWHGKLSDEAPVFFFDYKLSIKKYGLFEEGFIFTTRGVRAKYSDTSILYQWKLIPYEDIVKVEYKRVLLASVMDIYYENDFGIEDKLRCYLSGIEKPNIFVEIVKKYLGLILN